VSGADTATLESPDGYPRDLTPLEQDLLAWVLPADSPGYLACWNFIGEAVVIGEGRRGEGEIIVGKRGSVPDFGSPLGPVFSFGVAEIPGDVITVTVRELTDSQVSVEIVGGKTDMVPGNVPVMKRWTYANWKPGLTCPQCGGGVREITIGEGMERAKAGHTLGICVTDRRLWVFDGIALTCRPIPLTNYYNELMLLKSIRDPEIALDGKKLFEHLQRYTDADLAAAFLAYNRLNTKIPGIRPDAPSPKPGGGIIRQFLGKLRR
jgi:hypothetical protein